MKSNKRIIRVVDYDSRWPDLFQMESKAISDALGDLIVRIHHIGGTAVPGLAAKPTIDILLEVEDVNQLDRYNAQMEKLGYTPEGEYGIPGRRYFHKGNPDRTYHVHAFNAGSDGALRHIAFRDYLIAHPQIAREYGDLKRRCARDCDNDIDKYGDLKNDFIKTHEKRAMQWMRGR
ncbi:MAG: GrpB family protein [Candidatus Zixiibacteriota bacterium]|nr:MAG: GrpB family protein [candidate division Zixibacteria bacterium]